ncbi:MAG: ABC transporter permease [Defluviitaleaceae bacterium]|nr:ABC transporter permease [Defluviitaleaceae bacterium]
MSNFDVFMMCLRSLLKRKLRTFLTVLGVIIGTACIIVMISLGLAINIKFEQQLETMGDVTVITVNAGSYYYGDRGDGMRLEAQPLDDNAIARFERLPGVVVATPMVRANLFFKSGKYVLSWSNVYGIKPEAMSLMGYVPAEGRLLEPGDNYNVVFGYHTEKNFYDPNSWGGDRLWDAMRGLEVATYVDIFRDKITMSYDYNYVSGSHNSEQEYDFEDENAPKPIKPFDIKVVGLLEYKNDWNTDASIFMDIEIVKKLKADAERQNKQNNQEWGSFSAVQGGQDMSYEMAYVKCENLSVVKETRDKIEEMGFYAYYPAQYLDYLQDQASTTQALLGFLGGISLVIAAIGIANTMITATYERTREIGVMKVIGARLNDVRRLFLLEAALIGLIGGAIGVGLSLLASYALNNVTIPLNIFGDMFNYIGDPNAGIVSYVPPWLCGLAMLVSAVIGLVSGYFPARRATRLSALTAIRTD